MISNSNIASGARGAGGLAVIYVLFSLIIDPLVAPCWNPLDRFYTTAAWTTVCFLVYDFSLACRCGARLHSVFMVVPYLLVGYWLWSYGGTESVIGAFVSAGVRYAQYNTTAFLLAPVLGVALAWIKPAEHLPPGSLLISVPVFGFILWLMFIPHIEIIEMAGSFALVSHITSGLHRKMYDFESSEFHWAKLIDIGAYLRYLFFMGNFLFYSFVRCKIYNQVVLLKIGRQHEICLCERVFRAPRCCRAADFLKSSLQRKAKCVLWIPYSAPST